MWIWDYVRTHNWHQTPNIAATRLLLQCSRNTYKSWSLPAVPWLNIQRHFEQVVSKLLLTPVAHRVQVLEEPLCNKKKVMFWVQDLWNMLKEKEKNLRMSAHPDFVLHLQTVGLVLILLDLSCDFSYFPPLAEVDQLLAVAFEEVWVTFLCLQDVG